MSTQLVRACLLALVSALTASAGGQPPDEKKAQPKGKNDKSTKAPYTAFPDLKSPDEGKDVPLPALPKVANDAPALRKVQLAQLKEGLAYLERAKEVIRVGSYSPQYFRDYILVAADTYRVGAELEEEPAKRVPWFEARVRKLKELERFIETLCQVGREPPQSLNLARFQRLQAEAELLKLKEEVEKAKGK